MRVLRNLITRLEHEREAKGKTHRKSVYFERKTGKITDVVSYVYEQTLFHKSTQTTLR